MKKYIFYAGALCLTIVATSCGSDNSTDSKKEAEQTNEAKIDSANKMADSSGKTTAMADMKPDAEFAVTVADVGMMEVQLGKLAQEKGTSAAVKKFGATMVKEHTAAGNELAALAKEKNITLPASLSDKCQKKVQELTDKTGADFDKAYASAMVDGHKETIDTFKKEADKGNDPQLMAWAKKTIPTLEHHLSMAEDTKKVVDKTK